MQDPLVRSKGPDVHVWKQKPTYQLFPVNLFSMMKIAIASAADLKVGSTSSALHSTPPRRVGVLYVVRKRALAITQAKGKGGGSKGSGKGSGGSGKASTRQYL
jgi:hypothetical protein